MLSCLLWTGQPCCWLPAACRWSPGVSQLLGLSRCRPGIMLWASQPTEQSPGTKPDRWCLEGMGRNSSGLGVLCSLLKERGKSSFFFCPVKPNCCCCWSFLAILKLNQTSSTLFWSCTLSTFLKEDSYILDAKGKGNVLSKPLRKGLGLLVRV